MMTGAFAGRNVGERFPIVSGAVKLIDETGKAYAAIAHEALYDDNHAQVESLLSSRDPHKAPQPTTTKPSNRHSLLLYNAAYGTLAPTDLLRRADENWTRSHPYSRFGPSYHTSLPSHWAQQLQGLNLTVTLHN